MRAGSEPPYNQIDFERLALAEFPELREEFNDNPGLLHLQMHALERLAERAKDAADWAAYSRCMKLADRLWSRSDESLLNALNVSFLEHLEFDGPQGSRAWGFLSAELKKGWRDMQEYMRRLAEVSAPPQKQRPVKARRRRR